jgi:hypothetical protein
MAKLGGLEEFDAIAVKDPPFANNAIAAINMTENNREKNSSRIFRPSARVHFQRYTIGVLFA